MFAFLDDDPHNALDTLHDDRVRTLLRRLPRSDWSKVRKKASDLIGQFITHSR